MAEMRFDTMKKQKILSSILLFGFLLGIYEGKIALWSDHKKEPIRVLPYSASILPKNDRQRLQNGIRFNTLDELKDFVEDYLS